MMSGSRGSCDIVRDMTRAHLHRQTLIQGYEVRRCWDEEDDVREAKLIQREGERASERERARARARERVEISQSQHPSTFTIKTSLYRVLLRIFTWGGGVNLVEILKSQCSGICAI